MFAFYKLRFYELDQPIAVGDEREYEFFVDPHFVRAPATSIETSMMLCFANTVGNDSPTVRGQARIKSITHPELGRVQSVDTRGLDYRIVLADGRNVVVEAEQTPGEVYDGAFKFVTDWAFMVEIEPR